MIPLGINYLCHGSNSYLEPKPWSNTVVDMASFDDEMAVDFRCLG